MSKGLSAIDLIDRLFFIEDLAAKKPQGSGSKEPPKTAVKEITTDAWRQIDLIFCEYHYKHDRDGNPYKEAERGNPLFALEAYKIHRELNLPIDHNDWFMVHFFIFSLEVFKLFENFEDGDLGSKEIPAEIYRVFRQGYQPPRQNGRSLFTEYSFIKEKLEKFKKIHREIKGGTYHKIAYSKVAEEYALGSDTMKDLYKETIKILLHKKISP